MYDRPAGGVKLGWPYKKHFCGTFYDESMLLAENAKILCCHIKSDILMLHRQRRRRSGHRRWEGGLRALRGDETFKRRKVLQVQSPILLVVFRKTSSA